MYQAGEPGLSIRHEYCEEIATTMIDRPSDRAAMIMEFSIHDESCPGDGSPISPLPALLDQEDPGLDNALHCR